MRQFLDHIDRYWIGILIGLALPSLFGYAYIQTFHLWEALRAFHFQAGSMLSKMFLVSFFPDMAFLFVFYQLDTWKLAKGILIGGMPYVLAAILTSV